MLFIATSNKMEIPADNKELADTASEEVSPTDYVTINKGDTLYSLAKRYGTSVKQLQDLNNLEGSLLKIGMQLRVN
jgi:LysM repeat protein